MCVCVLGNPYIACLTQADRYEKGMSFINLYVCVSVFVSVCVCVSVCVLGNPYIACLTQADRYEKGMSFINLYVCVSVFVSVCVCVCVCVRKPLYRLFNPGRSL